MIHSADPSRRPRRFFGLRGVVRRLRRADTADSVRGRRHPATEPDRALQSERARFAASVDRELRLACRSEAAMRRELGCAARDFMRRRAYRRLGFVPLSDYARERLGVSARTLQSAAWLATRLDALPAVARAYDCSELSWAQARAICKVAVVADEEQWLELARRSTVETLERLVTCARQPDGVPADPDGEPNEIDGEPAVRWRFVCPARVRALWRRALELASRAAGEPLADWRAAEIVAAEGSSGRPVGRSLGDRMLIEAIRLARRARRQARNAVDPNADRLNEDAATARPVRGARGVDARIGFADASLAARSPTADPPINPPTADLPTADAPTADPHPDPATADAPTADPRPDPATADAPTADPHPDPRAGHPPSVDSPAPRGRETLLLESPAPSDPVALDARLVEAIRVLRTIEPKIGRLLRVVVDQRIYRWFGYPAFDDYVRERLGISARKAWALLKIEKATVRSGDFASAYRDGRLSWVRALTLLPVLERTHAAAWVARAETVTVRRLCDEVDWVLAAREALGPSVSLGPPPVDSRLASPIVVTPPAECRDLSPDARLQIRAHSAELPTAVSDRHELSLRDAAPEVCDAEVRFTGPASVVALLRDVLEAFAEPAEPRWTALERLLRHVVTHWESTPRHHDPVFARDGWRCTVPACSARRNLHDHHIRFRSRGGDNRRDNRTVVCAAHHLHGIHDGTIDASGVAPHAIEWRLGVRPGAPPFLTFVGDRYCRPESADMAAAGADESS